MTAQIYKRRNGRWGSSVEGCGDTGHVITGGEGDFTVLSIKDDETVIARNVARGEAEAAIERDWRQA
jgi:hypothetical protein